ncbi:MAG: hypothetical protein ACSHWW_11555 [Nonlabens sp.]|uniref:hypothetical protein n=1 Tax=Nonlabens sp. TaxID=1888209 RepID=UPI003EF54306
MKKTLLLLALVIAITSCTKPQDPFEWNKDRVGHLTKEMMVYQLDSLYANDSLVKNIKGDEFSNGPSPIEVYEKGGKHLLTLTPLEEDSTSTIEYVRVRDNRFKTLEGVTIESDFKTISTAYNVSSIDNMIKDAVVRVNDHNFYFTVDKELLPAEIRFDMTAAIEKTMIPDSAKPKYVFVSW